MFGGRRRRLPQDGTFNQTQPFDRLVGSRHSFSFDLKSATDRWPLVFLFEVVQYLFDRSFASSVVNSAFACNIFEVPFVKLKRRFSQVCFVAGQPLGYHGSWPTFALSHHILVWWCAKQVHPGVRFTSYAVLGDDVVIADQEVAKVYESALGGLGVKISYQKSLIPIQVLLSLLNASGLGNLVLKREIFPRESGVLSLMSVPSLA
uniref:Uncharacterized mitochondrial protein AtMg01410 n=1 Tax=Arabidopsis thaliana TaxID=3702 RepID=M1410_ARATH|nr:RecName: Full=Uncharacterized mitochondrial protein AtMg01410; AltName: Full=ORF204 [Arabidopsis thaliana]CAA69788.1 unnamed protein product [Arabidopsis thaliana]